MIRTAPLSNDEVFDRWQTDLLKASISHRHSVWSIGDLLLEGERKFDDARYIQALEATRLTIETLTNYKSLAKCFPAGKRRLNLGVSHHEAIRSLDEPARDALLDLVEKHEITRENLRDRVKAYKGGDLGALAFKWRQKNEVREVEDSHAGVIGDDDKPVFDSTGAGEGMAAERDERRAAHGDQSLSDANQMLLDAATASEKALSHSNISFANLEALSAARFHALANRYAEVAAIIDAAHENAFKRQSTRRRNSSAPEASPSLHGGADQGGDETSSPSSPTHSDQTGGCVSVVCNAVAGHGADESPALIQADAEAMAHEH